MTSLKTKKDMSEETKNVINYFVENLMKIHMFLRIDCETVEAGKSRVILIMKRFKQTLTINTKIGN